MEKYRNLYSALVVTVIAVISSLSASASEVADSALFPEHKGKYIFVPDSLQGDVLKILKGHSKVVDDENKISPTEKVTWKGDTLPMRFKTRNLGRFDRGLSNYLFIPRGQWSFGLTASYGEISTDKLQMMGLLSDIDISGHIFSVKPYLMYFIRNNTSVGMRFGYTSAKGNVDSFNLDIDDDMNFSLHDIMYRNEAYTAALTLRQYIGMARKGRFGIFNEVELAFSSGNSDFARPYGGELRNTHTTYMDASLNFSPGVCVFIMENVSFNLSFGVFGFSMRNEKQMEDGVEVGNRMTSGANFRFNIFNLNFGIAVHL